MIRRGIRIPQIVGGIGVFLLALFLYINLSFAGTTITSPSECVRIVTLKIEIYSNTNPYIWSQAQLDAMDADTKKWATELMASHTNYSDAELAAIGAEWKAEVENAWNGPTEDQVNAVAEELGYTDQQVSDAAGGDMKLRKEIADKVAKHLEQYGGSPDSDKCTEVNCCKIYFKVDVKVRKSTDPPTEGYNQIEVMKKGYRSNVTTHADGLHGNHKGTKGKWAYDKDNPWGASAAHECGHLMGLDDQYTDAGGTNAGHEHDVMGVSFGYPPEEALQEILTAGGAACDCCPKVTDVTSTSADTIFQEYGMTYLVAGDAMLTKNCPHMKAALKSFQNQLKTVNITTGLSVTQRADIVSKLNSQIKKLTAAIKECDPPQTATGIGTEGIPYAPFSYDALECTTYGGGTVIIPLFPMYPFGPYFPFFPIGPVEGPAGTPGTTPETPGSTPGSTPGGPQTPASGTGDPTTPLWPIFPGGPLVPFGPYEYDDDPPIPGRTDEDEGDPPGDIRTPYDGYDRVVPEGVVPEGDGEEETPQSQMIPESWYIFKVEQDIILENGDITTGPAEKTVLKFGFPVPDAKPGSDVVRTAEDTNNGAGSEPRFAETDDNGIGVLPIFSDGFESGDTSAWSNATPAPSKDGAKPAANVTGVTLDATPTKSHIVYLDAGTPAQDGGQTELPDSVKPYVIDSVLFGDTLGVTLSYKYHLEDQILNDLEGFFYEGNYYRVIKMDDPYYASSGTWGQPYDDQWAIKSVGFTDDGNGAWEVAGDDLAPVIVAFIDTGLDWNHADISWDNVWVNEDEIPDNGIDDDMNGYIDDTIGWDFYTNNPTPWDQDGHGTFTAGMVIAAQNNGIGIAGINPAAKVMILKALNDFGHTRASYIAKAIKYAADNGARVINLSTGGEHMTYLEELAVKYAHERNVVIVVAAGNEAMEVSDYGLVPYDEVIAVAATDFDGKRVFFSNLGPEIDIAAPGLDVLSLRARMTDFMRHLKDIPYEAGSAYVGEDNRYFRSSGTSFSAPIVTGIASLILSMNPDLTNVEVKRMILNSARDVELPGTDQYTGYGVVDAVAALNADPAFEIVADIASVNAIQDDAGGFFVDVQGSASANDFAGATVQIGIGETPTAWKEVATVDGAVTDGALALIDANEFRTATVWTIRIVVNHANGRTREQWYVLELG